MAGRCTGLDYGTAGESHGPCVLTTITGLPAGLVVDADFINAELSRRQGGYGRGGRQKIETDRAEFLSGVRLGKAIGSPLTISVVNRDSRLDDLEKTPPVSRPRPGHADLAGAIKALTTDCRNTLERASARETAGRVAAGAVARCLLREIGIEVFGFVRSIGGAHTGIYVNEANWRDALIARDESETYCPDATVTEQQCQLIRHAKIDKDTLGGLCEVHVFGCPIGLGSTVDWRAKLDANIAMAVMSIQAFKSVEIGMGRAVADIPGSHVHDPIGFDAARRNTPSLGFVRTRNNAGGIEGGMTNGQPVVVRGAMKPISTLLQGMPSIDLDTLQPEQSQYERSDVCAVPAASVVMENAVAFEIARAATAKYAGDTVDEFVHAWNFHLSAARQLGTHAEEHTKANKKATFHP